MHRHIITPAEYRPNRHCRTQHTGGRAHSIEAMTNCHARLMHSAQLLKNICVVKVICFAYDQIFTVTTMIKPA